MQSSRTVIGLDIAKRVFQLHWVDMETGELMNLRLTRAKLLEHFGNRAPCLVGMEACGGSQHWARRLQSLGHEVRLLPAKMVRPFVSGNKNDARDAQAIWTAVQQPGVKTVAVKSEEQQGILALHRMRQQLVKFRTAQINGLRGLLTEYGEVMPRGRAGMRRDMAAALERVSERLPAMVIETLREQWARVTELDVEVETIERRIAVWHRQNVASRRIAAIPGVGGTDRDRRGRHDGRSGHVPVRTRVRRLAGAGTPAHRDGRAGAHARHLQARGHVSAHAADPWCPLGTHQRQGAVGVAAPAEEAASGQCRRRGAGEQDGAHDLGCTRP